MSPQIISDCITRGNTMNKTSKKLIFSVLLFSLSVPLTSCHFIYDRPEPDWKWDERQYVNYEKIYHIKEEGDKDYYDIDFTKDVFPNGILIDQEGKQYNLKDEYDTVEISEFESRTNYINHKFLCPFKVRFYTWDIIHFVFINQKTSTRSARMCLGRFLDPQEENTEIVHIKKIDDFKSIETNNIVYLDNDIDFNGYIFNEKNTCIFGDYFNGLFLNPDKHVLKNIKYENHTSGYGYHTFITKYCWRAWFDSLIIDNFEYIGHYDEKGNDRNVFAIIATYAKNNYFNNCKITNFKIETNDLYAAPFINTSNNCDFYNCVVSGDINNRYEPITHTTSGGKEELGLYGRTAGFCNEFVSTYSVGNGPFEGALRRYQDTRTNENFTKLVDKVNNQPVVSEFRNNQIHVNVRGKGKSGGMFNSIARIDHFFTNNFFLGDIEGQFTDKIYNDNFFYQSDNRRLDYSLYC